MSNAGELPKPWYKKRRNQVLVALVVLLIIVWSVPYLTTPPPTAAKLALNRSVTYFAKTYDFNTGLISVTPGNSTFWLYSDNYLASLALSRYDPQNQSTVNFGASLLFVISGFASTLPASETANQYTALNSTDSSFRCAHDYTLTWSGGLNASEGTQAATVRTTANDGDSSCAKPTANYADLQFLQAVYYHRLGNATGAASYYNYAVSSFDGTGFADSAYTSQSSSSYHLYQTYKVALYVYSTICLGQQQSQSARLNNTEGVLLSTQAPSGGFSTGYEPNLLTQGARVIAVGGVNTETTALAALALELMVNPSAAC